MFTLALIITTIVSSIRQRSLLGSSGHPVINFYCVTLFKLKTKFQKLLAFLLLLVVTPIGFTNQAGAITYGDPVGNAVGLFPEVISLWEDDGDGYLDHICTAVLIEQQIAITAAHCVQGAERDLYVEVGTNILGQGEDIRVNASWYNPRYSSRRIANDVGLLHLSRPANVSRLAQLARKSKLTEKSKLQIAGWGVNQNGDNLDQLHKLSVRLDNKGAQKRFGREFNPNTTVGAGRYFRTERVYGGACNGDSGGPLYEGKLGKRPKLVGIISYGVKGCDENTPTVFARVDYYYKALRQGIRNVKERARQEEELINSNPLTASFSLSKPYTSLNLWSAEVTANTVSKAIIEKWCFFINDRAVTYSEIDYGSGQMPFLASSSDGCFRQSIIDSLVSGSVLFRFNALAPGAYRMHAVVTDSLGRTVTTPAQEFTR